jgi:hypothetical protein
MKSFSKDVRIVPILTYASGTSDRVSNVIDTRGFTGCCVVVHFGTIAASAVTDIYLQEADVASDSTTLTSGADLAGTSQTVAADDDNECKFIDVRNPLKRFLQLNVNKDATNACAESAVAYLYNGSVSPVTHAEGTGTSGGVDIAEGEFFVSPIAGTK